MSTGCTVEKSIISVACIRTVKINSKNTNYIAHHIVGVSKAKNQICKHSHNVCARFSLAKCFSYKFFFRVSVALEIRMLTHSNCVGKFSSHVRYCKHVYEGTLVSFSCLRNEWFCCCCRCRRRQRYRCRCCRRDGVSLPFSSAYNKCSFSLIAQDTKTIKTSMFFLAIRIGFCILILFCIYFCTLVTE